MDTGGYVPRRIMTEHTYDVGADTLWACCISYKCLAETMASLMSYDGFPEGNLETGQSIEVQVTHFGFMPPMPWWIEVLERDDQRHVLKTSERGGAMKSYLHTMTIQELAPDRSLLIDEVEFDAGWLSWPMQAWIRHIYKTRDKPRRRLLGLTEQTEP
ncbi:MAG: hypothetical protein RIC29_14695 [Rhodospirillaceae bacterium]